MISMKTYQQQNIERWDSEVIIMDDSLGNNYANKDKENIEHSNRNLFVITNKRKRKQPTE